MHYVKLNTDIPVPDVLMYDMDTDGLVGGSWMAMEFVRERLLDVKLTAENSLHRSVVTTSGACGLHSRHLRKRLCVSELLICGPLSYN